MTHRNQFIIRNDLFQSLILNIEPEGAFFPLNKGEEVLVLDTCSTTPVTVKFTLSDKGEPIISLWPGDGDVRVEKDGVDVLELLQPEVSV